MNDSPPLVPPIERAKNRGRDLLAQAERDLEAGRIDEAGWHAAVAAVIAPAYLAADNPRAQSGHSGDEAHWTQARSLLAHAIDRDGTFLDVGCANGYLMQCLVRWAMEKGGHRVEPYGLDISPELAALARSRLPDWSERIFIGNALEWLPSRGLRFVFVRTGLEYVPKRRQRDLILHLLDNVVAPGGRLIIGVYNEEPSPRAGSSIRDQILAWGLRLGGESDRPHYRDPRLRYKILWIDA